MKNTTRSLNTLLVPQTPVFTNVTQQSIVSHLLQQNIPQKLLLRQEIFNMLNYCVTCMSPAHTPYQYSARLSKEKLENETCCNGDRIFTRPGGSRGFDPRNESVKKFYEEIGFKFIDASVDANEM